MPLWEPALKELEASENGFKETLLPWQDYPFQHSCVRIQLELVQSTECERSGLLKQRNEPKGSVVFCSYSSSSEKRKLLQKRFIIWTQTVRGVQAHPISSV